jgi:Fungal Zn(2)-Cys(6) binuclear cluster domain
LQESSHEDTPPAYATVFDQPSLALNHPPGTLRVLPRLPRRALQRPPRIRFSAYVLPPPAFRPQHCFVVKHCRTTRAYCARFHDTGRAMDPSFPHILNPRVTGSSFGPMTTDQDPLPHTQTPTAPSITHSYQDIAANGSRKRPASRIKSTYPRKRAIQACQKCRARRTKCNNARPACYSCLDLGVDCSYSEGDPSRYISLGVSHHGVLS